MAVTSVTHAVFPGEAVERILEGSPETIANAAVLTMAATPVTIVSAVAGHILRSLRAWSFKRRRAHTPPLPPLT